MVTKKKSTSKSKKSTASKAPKASRVTTSGVVADVFETREQPEHEVQVPKGYVRLFVNSHDKGNVPSEGQKLKEFAVHYAQQAGIRSFSLYVDGAKATTAQAGAALSTISKIEIVAKDARG